LPRPERNSRAPIVCIRTCHFGETRFRALAKAPSLNNTIKPLAISDVRFQHVLFFVPRSVAQLAVLATFWASCKKESPLVTGAARGGQRSKRARMVNKTVFAGAQRRTSVLVASVPAQVRSCWTLRAYVTTTSRRGNRKALVPPPQSKQRSGGLTSHGNHGCGKGGTRSSRQLAEANTLQYTQKAEEAGTGGDETAASGEREATESTRSGGLTSHGNRVRFAAAWNFWFHAVSFGNHGYGMGATRAPREPADREREFGGCCGVFSRLSRRGCKQWSTSGTRRAHDPRCERPLTLSTRVLCTSRVCLESVSGVVRG
jgi:hypothetical protein